MARDAHNDHPPTGGESDISYADYYAECRRRFPANRGERHPTVYDTGVMPLYQPAAGSSHPLKLSTRDLARIDLLAGQVAERMGDPRLIYGDPEVESHVIKLHQIWDLEQLCELAEAIVPQIEENVFRSYVVVNAVHVARSLQTLAPPTSSWLWHFDDSPAEAIKLMIYLTDVHPDAGPFEYLRHHSTGKPALLDSSRLSFARRAPQRRPGSRIDAEEMASWIGNGYAPTPVVGPRGTMILFDNNCIHRGTVPRRGYRDVAILNLRPSHRLVRPAIARPHTGSWDVDSKRWHPWRLAQRPGRTSP